MRCSQVAKPNAFWKVALSSQRRGMTFSQANVLGESCKTVEMSTCGSFTFAQVTLLPATFTSRYSKTQIAQAARGNET